MYLDAWIVIKIELPASEKDAENTVNTIPPLRSSSKLTEDKKSFLQFFHMQTRDFRMPQPKEVHKNYEQNYHPIFSSH